MNLNKDVGDVISIQEAREYYIKKIEGAENRTEYVRQNAESLFAIGLTMYSNTFSFGSAIYKGLTCSRLDEKISLHPEQINAIKIFESNRGVVFSAPTSFGKTFTIFEYIARNNPNTVVLVVPTLALIDEYKRKIINTYKNVFKEYRVYLSIEENGKYDFERKNIFIVTHDRVVNENIQEIIPKIDFLVIDEVYKLQKDENDDRVLILNLAYYNLVAISMKYVLLAPFIKGVENKERLDHEPVFHATNYSPVVNDVKTIPIIDESDRLKEVDTLLNTISGDTLVYFPTVKMLDQYIFSGTTYLEHLHNEVLQEFISWAISEVHEKWSVILALEKGFLVHHGQLPMGIRMLELDLFNNPESGFDKMLCTSTLLEGVNTTAENIIISKAARNKTDFDAFDFYNLVGRTGRLFQHYLGKAYYIKGPADRDYIKSEALKSIEFELTTESIDIDINTGNYQKHPNFIYFLNNLEITYDIYKKELASKCRFSTVQYLYDSYRINKQDLLEETEKLISNHELSKLQLIRCLYKIIEKNNYKFKLRTFIINRLTYKNRQSVKQVIDATMEYYSHEDIQSVIKETLEKKNSYIEYTFYKKVNIILFFMECENETQERINLIRDKLLKNIEYLYYINMPAHKILKEIGIYDMDIQGIINVIGDDFDTIDELQNRLRSAREFPKMSVVSKYVLQRIIK